MTSFICKQVNEHHSIGNLQDKKFLSDRNFINEIDGEVMAEVNHILGGCQKQLGMQLSDNGYLHLLVSKNSNSLMQKYLSSRSMPFPNIL